MTHLYLTLNKYKITHEKLLERKIINSVMKKTNHKERISLYVPKRIKRRVKNLADDEGTNMNDLILKATQNYLAQKDAEYSSPDFVMERLGEVLNSQLAVVNAINKQTELLTTILDKLDNIEEKQNE